MFSKTQRLVLLAILPSLAHAQTGNSYTQTNLVSDGSVKAQQTDTQLINPWGVAIGQQTPFWINAVVDSSLSGAPIETHQAQLLL